MVLTHHSTQKFVNQTDSDFLNLKFFNSTHSSELFILFENKMK